MRKRPGDNERSASQKIRARQRQGQNTGDCPETKPEDAVDEKRPTLNAVRPKENVRDGRLTCSILVLTRGFLTIGLLLACSLCWNCRKKTPEPQPEQQAADGSVAETATTVQSQPPAPSGKIPLRILYVGLPGTERQKDFLAFLGKHFTEVDLENVMLGFAPGKSYQAAAICRHGNFLQWGHAAAPSRMTPAG